MGYYIILCQCGRHHRILRIVMKPFVIDAERVEGLWKGSPLNADWCPSSMALHKCSCHVWFSHYTYANGTPLVSMLTHNPTAVCEQSVRLEPVVFCHSITLTLYSADADYSTVNCSNKLTPSCDILPLYSTQPVNCTTIAVGWGISSPPCL